MPAAIWETTAVVISNAAVELGLVPADIADPFASTDPNVLQLVRLLNGVGRKLVRAFPWSHLQREYTFNTANGVGDYALPADYARPIDQTQWNRSTMLPVGGPVSPSQWQFLKSVLAGGLLYKMFRTRQDVISLHPTPGGVETIALEYISNNWVAAATTQAILDLSLYANNAVTSVLRVIAGGVTGNATTFQLVRGLVLAVTINRAGNDFVAQYRDGISTVGNLEAAIGALAGADKLIEVKTPGNGAHVITQGNDDIGPVAFGGGTGTGLPAAAKTTAKDDVLWFDSELLKAALKLEFRSAKGFDTTKEQGDYDEAFADATGADGAAPVLSLNRRTEEPLLTLANVPPTGFGS